MIAMKDVQKRYGDTTVLSSISFQIDPKEFVCITGPSGAGKSTLIHLLVGAETPTSGFIEVDGVDLRRVPPPAMQVFRRRVGVIFQDYKLLWHRTVAENIGLPLQVTGAPKKKIDERVKALLEQMELTHRANTLAHALSGGEKARTAIARAIVHSPIIVLADEPTGNLDPKQSKDVLDLLRKVNADGATVILATHDTALVDMLNTRVIRMEGGGVTRDSIGGYAHAPAVQRKEPTSVSVQSSSSAKKPAPKKKDAGDSPIKITAISSGGDDD